MSGEFDRCAVREEECASRSGRNVLSFVPWWSSATIVKWDSSAHDSLAHENRFLHRVFSFVPLTNEYAFTFPRMRDRARSLSRSCFVKSIPNDRADRAVVTFDLRARADRYYRYSLFVRIIRLIPDLGERNGKWRQWRRIARLSSAYFRRCYKRTGRVLEESSPVDSSTVEFPLTDTLAPSLDGLDSTRLSLSLSLSFDSSKGSRELLVKRRGEIERDHCGFQFLSLNIV